MKQLFLLAFLCAVFVPDARGDEVIDSGWLVFTPPEIAQGYDAPRFSISEMNVVERSAIHTDALSVLKMEFNVKNKVDYTLFFDIDVIAFSDSGEILFAMKFAPDLFGLGDGMTAPLSQTRYVLPDTLARVAHYKCRFIGFR